MCRLVSSQKERDFSNTDYDDIKRVFSIWICMNQKETSMNYVHLTNDSLLGNCQWEGKLDLLNIVLIGLTDKLPEQDTKHRLHRLLGALREGQKEEQKAEPSGKPGLSQPCTKRATPWSRLRTWWKNLPVKCKKFSAKGNKNKRQGAVDRQRVHCFFAVHRMPNRVFMVVLFPKF